MPAEQRTARPVKSSTITFIVCAILLVTFAFMSWTAVITKSATADEPLHAMGAYMRLFYHDFRLNCEDPPLFGYWAMIPHSAKSLKVNRDMAQWQQIPEYIHYQFIWCIMTLYRTPPNDPDAFITASRAMMLILGVGLGVVLASWSWKLAGPVAAVAATALYAFDPNFLGHAPLVKNDVPITLVFFSTMLVTWSVVRQARWWNILLLATLIGIGANVKFSGVIIGPVAALCLFGAALLPKPWILFGKTLDQAVQKLLTATGILLVCGGMTILITWASYGFRYAPMADPQQRLSMPLIVEAARSVYVRTETFKRGIPPPPGEVDAFANNLFIRSVLSADKHRLLPHAWLAGLLWTYSTTIGRQSYLNGQLSQVGWWYYFPLAMLYKTPTATLAAMGLAVVIAVVLRRRVGVLRLDHRTLVCIAVPVGIYAYFALTGQVNLGLRHVFPIYPFIYLLIAVMTARAWNIWPGISRAICTLLALGLAIESVAAHPNYIAFFNAPSGGWRNGINLLGDSNLDWGQDLLLLKAWQQAHPDTKLYLAYFGQADPKYYVKCDDLPGTFTLYADPQYPRQDGVAAVSATVLQGIYLGWPQDMLFYQRLIQVEKPFDILGGTIYLFDIKGPPSMTSTTKP